MLIQFSVANFRSIREEQTLQLVASDDDEMPENVIAPQTRGGYPLLCSCGIFGANASGKSNLLLALDTMRTIVTDSAKDGQRGDLLPVTPFLLHSAAAAQPSEFEIHFIAQDIRYQYGFVATPSAITQEWLFAYPNGERQTWFERELQDGGTYKWSWDGSRLTARTQSLHEATRDNALFLSTAVQFNSAELQPVFDWFKKTLQSTGVETLDTFNFADVTAKMMEAGHKPDVMAMLQSADLGIGDVHVAEKEFDANKLPRHLSAFLRNELARRMKGASMLSVTTFHANEKDEEIAFDWNQESVGTRRFFSLIGPWLLAMQNGYVLVIDEFDQRIHPHLARFLVDMFHNPDINRNNAQLVFAAHDTTLLSPRTMRQDQIWFCEKDGNETQLHPLSDYALDSKQNSKRENMYLWGQFGAVPFITDFDAGRPE